MIRLEHFCVRYLEHFCLMRHDDAWYNDVILCVLGKFSRQLSLFWLSSSLLLILCLFGEGARHGLSHEQARCRVLHVHTVQTLVIDIIRMFMLLPVPQGQHNDACEFDLLQQKLFKQTLLAASLRVWPGLESWDPYTEAIWPGQLNHFGSKCPNLSPSLEPWLTLSKHNVPSDSAYEAWAFEYRLFLL